MSNDRLNFSNSKETSKKLSFELLYVSTSKYEGDWQSLPHTHHFTEFFYVISGQGYFLVEDEQITVRENDMVVVNPNVEHTEKSMNAKPLEYLVFGVEGLTFVFGKGPEAKNYGYYHYAADKIRLLNIPQLALTEITNKNPGYESICCSLLDILIIYITRNYQYDILPSGSSRMPRECAIAKRYLDANYSQNITLDSLAEATHTNKYYLSHSFSKALGMSPINYLIERRLMVCRDMLTQTNYSIADIASSTGFSSQSYFSQMFRKAEGMSPGQYRRSMGKTESEKKKQP